MSSPTCRGSRSLKVKLLFPLLLIGAVFAAVSVAAIYAKSRQLLTDKLNRRAEVIVNSVNYAAESVSRAGALQRFVTAVGAEADVNLIVVVGGRPALVLASTRNAWLGQALTQLPVKEVAEDLGEAMRTRQGHSHLHFEAAQCDFTAPLLLSRPELADRALSDGAVMVHLDMRATEGAIRQQALLFSLGFLVMLGLAGLLGYVLISRIILRPIDRIGEIVEHHRDGAGARVAMPDADDELGALARALDNSLTCTDTAIRELKAQKEKLKESAERHRAILLTAMDGFWLVDLKGRLVEVNEAYCRMSGYSAPELLTLSVSDLEAAETAADIAAHRRKILERGEDRFESRHRRKDGTVIDVEVSIQLRPDIDGSSVAFLRDITERKQAEAEKARLESRFLQAQKLESVGQLAGGVAHHFNNRLMGIMGYAQLCRDELGPEHPARRYVEEILVCAQRSAELTQQLLGFARKQVTFPKELDLNDAVSGVLKLLRRLVGSSIALVWEPSKGLWPVRVDSAQIDQLLSNLCVNTRDAIAGAKTIVLKTANVTIDKARCVCNEDVVPGEYVLLAVSDDGCGMDRESISKMFEPFPSTKDLSSGGGLEIATVYGIVKQNSGFIEVESAPGKGTTFKIYLPRVGAGEEARG